MAMRYRDRLHQLTVFYQAQDSTLKALGRSGELQFLIGQPNHSDPDNWVRCPQLTLFPEKCQQAALRGKVDSLAVRKRYEVSLHFLNVQSHSARYVLHNGFEQIRCEMIASHRLKGVAENLTAIPYQTYDESRVDKIIGIARQKIIDPSGLFIDDENDLLEVHSKLNELTSLIEDAFAYHRCISELADLLCLDDDLTDKATLNGKNLEEDNNASSLHISELQRSKANDSLNSESINTNVSAYKVLDRSQDLICYPSDLVQESRLQVLRERLDNELRANRVSLSRLAGRLMYALTTRTLDEWESDYEEGVLDPSRFDRLIVDPFFTQAYRHQIEQHNRNTLVTLLIDNSGSMRGRPITVAALCADMLTRTLERCGIKVEVLGFTTRYWRGGEIRKKWLRQGRPADPGRMNATQHIIYKSAEQSWRKSRHGLALMLEESLLKENIDGEALEWAVSRTAVRPESRKIVVVISDGVPRDEATNSANGDDYLVDHLKKVIGHIERNRNPELMAIGIGHDVSSYYRQAISIPSERTLGDTLVDQLTILFGEQVTSGNRRAKHSSVWAGAMRNAVSL